MNKLKSAKSTCPSLVYAGPTDVACDFCCGIRIKAIMSCLTCLASYCPSHLEPHYSVAVLKKHELVEATVSIQEKMCTKHNKLKELYCEQDEQLVCSLCTVDEHKGHGCISASALKDKAKVGARSQEHNATFQSPNASVLPNDMWPSDLLITNITDY